jgi:hypothetical protein
MDLATYLTTTKSTPETFSETSGTPLATLKKWLSGERTPRPEQQQRIMLVTKGKVTPTDFINTRLEWETKRKARAAA